MGYISHNMSITQDILFCGHKEGNSGVNQGNSRECMNLSLYLSPLSQTEVLRSVKKAEILSGMADEVRHGDTKLYHFICFINIIYLIYYVIIIIYSIII